MAKLCAVCESSEAKYKCPTCRAPYCSAVCCKKHKETPCEPPQPAQQSSAQPPAASGAANGVTPAPPAAKQQQRLKEEEEDDHPSAKLSEAQLDQLRTAADVKNMLANPAITQSLAQIDSSTDRMKALEKAMLDPTFASFMYQALDHVSSSPAMGSQ